jgi:flavin-dependent dehydrogenase
VAHYRAGSIAGAGQRGEMLVERDGYLGIAAIGGGMVNVSLVVEQAEVPALREKGQADDVIDRWIGRHAHIAARFARASRFAPVLVTGPFASRARRAWLPEGGLALVGDAADFFDPFTGEGMYSALLGGEALSHYARRVLRDHDTGPLQEYDRWRHAEFAAKWRVEEVIAMAVARPWLLERAARAFATRPDMAHLLVGVTGDFVPAREVLRPSYIAQLLIAAFSRPSPVLSHATSA